MTHTPTEAEVEAREQLASWMIERSFATGHGDTIDDLLIELDGQIKDRAALAESRLEVAVRVLEQISRMRPFPDSAINLITLTSARKLAEQTLAAILGSEGKVG